MKYINYKSLIPCFVFEVAEILRSNSFEVYIVGGCLRDLLLKNTPKDWDMATNATPNIIQNILSPYHIHIIEIGKKYGTLLLHSYDKNQPEIEITTYRTEKNYIKHRFPQHICFTSSLKDDLIRRDFTINALALNPFSKQGVLDFFGGIKDIRHKKIVCVKNPEKRLKEDSLRILRALRFAATIKFTIDTKTKKAIFKTLHYLDFIAQERIQAECNKMLLGDSISKIIQEYSIIFKKIFHLSDHHLHIHFSLFALKRIPKELTWRLAALLLHTDNPQKILKNLKYSNKVLEETLLIITYYHQHHFKYSENIKYHLYHIGFSRLYRILILKKLYAQYSKDYQQKNTFTIFIQQILSIQKNNECYSLKQLDIKGQDLLKENIEPRKIGYFLEQLLFAVIDGFLPNKYENLKKYVQKLKIISSD